MPITNAEAVRFANENCRVLADLIEQVDRTCQQFALNVATNWEDIAEVIAAADGDAIVDGAATDGRSPVTKLNVGQLKFVAAQVVACMATDDRRALVHNWVTNSTPRF